METDVYPVALDVDAFRFESDRVEVDGVDFAPGGEVDDVEPIVAWAVAIGQVGIATFDLAALGHFDAMDGGGVKYIGIGEVDFADSHIVVVVSIENMSRKPILPY